MKNKSLYLFLLFLFILIIKIILTIPFEGIFLYPDEFCVIQKAKYFIENFSIKPCYEIIGYHKIYDVSILYSLLISPFYYFFNGVEAYHGILILNSFLVSTLVFPIFLIIKRFQISNWINYILTSFLLFLPQIVSFEKTIMTETLYIVICIWLLHFYIKSFEKNKIQNKLISFFLAFLAIFTRPFGFIIPISILINELIQIKKHKKIISFGILLTFTFLLIFFINSSIFYEALVLEKIKSFFDLSNLPTLLLAFKNQINSFIVPTFFLPTLIFILYFNKKNLKKLNKIKYFVITLLILNFFISAQHIYGYMMDITNEGQPDFLSFLTRYIHLPIFIIILFSSIFLIKNKKFECTQKKLIILILFIIPIFFLDYSRIKYALNLDLDIFINYLFNYSIIALFFVLLVLFIFNKKKTLIFILGSLLIFNSIICYLHIEKQAKRPKNNIVLEYFQDTISNILIMNNNNNELSFYRPIATYTSNKITKYNSLSEIKKINNYNYIITPEKLDYPILFKGSIETIYHIPK